MFDAVVVADCGLLVRLHVRGAFLSAADHCQMADDLPLAVRNIALCLALTCRRVREQLFIFLINAR